MKIGDSENKADSKDYYSKMVEQYAEQIKDKIKNGDTEPTYQIGGQSFTEDDVKMGVHMKMQRGEMMGFNGCLGYDYHPEDKSITVNEAEAEIVRFIFDGYIEGYGAYSIAKELTKPGKLNKKCVVKWTDSGIRGTLKNEKYIGDALLQKTYIVDFLTKKRVYSSRYALSSIVVCGHCGDIFRRIKWSNRRCESTVWRCVSRVEAGGQDCPARTIKEEMLQKAVNENSGWPFLR